MKNPTDVNFASIGNQVRFLDTVKYYQQSLAALASSLTDDKKAAIYSKCEKYLLSDSALSKTFIYCTKEWKKWVLSYLSSGKGTIPYELVGDFDSLSIAPEDGDFFKSHEFYSSMKDCFEWKKYENLKKFYKTLKLNNLGELNQIYNFQDTIILCEIFERTSAKFQEMFKFNPKKCNSASSFTSCAHRGKSKCCIALPTDVEHVRVFEKTLIGGFSSINKRPALDTEILLNDHNNEKVLYELNIDGKKTNETYLIQNIDDEWEQPIWDAYNQAITIWLYQWTGITNQQPEMITSTNKSNEDVYSGIYTLKSDSNLNALPFPRKSTE